MRRAEKEGEEGWMGDKGERREGRQQQQRTELGLGGSHLRGAGQDGRGWETYWKMADVAFVVEQTEEQKMRKKHAWVGSKTELVVGYG